MGPPANSVWLPLLLLLMALATLATAQKNDTTRDRDFNSGDATSDSSSTTERSSTESDLLVAGDLNKAARVEQLQTDSEPSLSTPKTEPSDGTDGGPYDVIDVLAATSAGVGRPKSGQTTRIYTTGEVNDDFWLKHLGDDFKHAIHLQVGGTNDDYNRIINQTNNGVHEEVHHEYLPGAERPADGQVQEQQHLVRNRGYDHPNLVSQLDLDGEAQGLKRHYMRQQQQEQQQQHHHQRYTHSYTQPAHTHYNRHTYPQQQQQQLHTPQHTQRHNKSHRLLRNRYKQFRNPHSAPTVQSSSSSIINSSEDTLHMAQSQATPTSATSPSSSSPRRDDADRQLPFKSPFNDYGSRPTRDLTYLLYKRGL